MDDFEELELLSLVSKVTSELQNHLGISEKVLAEFIIAQRLECKTIDEFKQKLAGMGGAKWPDSLFDSVDRLVRTMHPKFKASTNGSHGVSADEPSHRSKQEKQSLFSGLAIPDRQPPADEQGDALDDALAQLEDLAPKASNPRTELPSRKRSRSPGDEDSRHRRKERRRSRERRDREQDDGHDHDRSRRKHRSRRDDRDRGRTDDDDVFKRRPEPEVDDAPVLYKVYDGHVTGLKDFGAFVNLHGVKGKVDGMVHISNLVQGQRVNHPSDLLTRGQDVKVKVVKIEANRVGLSMKDVDQESGQDLVPQARITSGANMESLGGGRNGYSDDNTAALAEYAAQPRRQKKRMTSPERWEIRQLIASGVAKASDYPDLEEDYNATLQGENGMELEEEVDIEVREEEPPFLVGQTKQSLELSPIRVVKAPDGSLNRAAMSGTGLAKERKELRRQEQEAATAAVEAETKSDLASTWNDPMANPESRQFANDLRNARLNSAKAPEATPEWKQSVMRNNESKGRRTNMSIKEQRESLPVYAFRSQLIKAVKENQFLVVVGETGSGKTTQLTQYLAEAGFTNDGMLGCTQPRRVAAISVAKRVSEEVGCELGQEVGYTVRFDDQTSSATKIKYMTDGMLQREILMDPNLERYSVIMLDEAHERTIATDILFALLKKTCKHRPDLKVIVTSATLDADKFSSYFNECPIFTIPGRTFPVEIYTRENRNRTTWMPRFKQSCRSSDEPPGDILLFLTGQEEIDTSCEILYERMKALGPNVPNLNILPVYSALPSEQQSRIFEPAPPGERKVVIATNIAETSITIDHIYYVIDPGFVKQNAYDPKLGMDALVVTPISQAQANQRAGRAGRTGPGKCFRLYTEAAYQSEMLPTTVPEIQRQNLSNTILMLKAMGINDLLNFDFMDPPPTNTMLTALEELYALSALDDEGLLTRLGRKMADFPMDPALSKVLIAAVDLDCSEEVLSIIAMLNVTTVFHRPKEKQQQADQKKAKFHDPAGDHLTLLNVYNAWKNSGFSNPWCFENFIQARAMRHALEVRKQIVQIMGRHRHQLSSCGRDTTKVRRALCAGFFRNSARKDPQEGYKTLIEGTPVYLHPSSALFGKQAEWVIYHTLVMTSKEYMTQTTTIEPKWLVEAAPTFFKVAPTDRLSKRKKAERIQPLYNKFAGEDDWRLSAQRKGGRGGGGGGTWG